MNPQPPSGFGKPSARKAAKTPAPKGKERRAVAAKQYDKLKADGLPEFNIYIRIQGQDHWFPAGSMAVNRSSAIVQAMYDNEQELLKGAFRLFPALRKQQNNLEYGYRLKQFRDEPIQVAVRPAPGVPGLLKQMAERLRSWFNKA